MNKKLLVILISLYASNGIVATSAHDPVPLAASADAEEAKQKPTDILPTLVQQPQSSFEERFVAGLRREWSAPEIVGVGAILTAGIMTAINIATGDALGHGSIHTRMCGYIKGHNPMWYPEFAADVLELTGEARKNFLANAPKNMEQNARVREPRLLTWMNAVPPVGAIAAVGTAAMRVLPALYLAASPVLIPALAKAFGR